MNRVHSTELFCAYYTENDTLIWKGRASGAESLLHTCSSHSSSKVKTTKDLLRSSQRPVSYLPTIFYIFHPGSAFKRPVYPQVNMIFTNPGGHLSIQLVSLRLLCSFSDLAVTRQCNGAQWLLLRCSQKKPLKPQQQCFFSVVVVSFFYNKQ